MAWEDFETDVAGAVEMACGAAEEAAASPCVVDVEVEVAGGLRMGFVAC